MTFSRLPIGPFMKTQLSDWSMVEQEEPYGEHWEMPGPGAASRQWEMFYEH